MRQLSSILKGCVLHMPLDEATYNPATLRLTDKSAFGNHGTSAFAGNFTADRMGQSVKAEVFNGTNDYIDCGDLGFVDNAFTMCAWWNQTSHTSSFASAVATVRGAPESTGAGFAPISNINLKITHGKPAAAYGTFNISQAYNFNQWYHTMLTYNGTTLKTYFNNQEIDSRNLNIPKSVLSFIGRWGDHDGYYFNGKIADVWVHNRALSESERTYLYESYNPSVII